MSYVDAPHILNYACTMDSFLLAHLFFFFSSVSYLPKNNQLTLPLFCLDISLANFKSSPCTVSCFKVYKDLLMSSRSFWLGLFTGFYLAMTQVGFDGLDWTVACLGISWLLACLRWSLDKTAWVSSAWTLIFQHTGSSIYVAVVGSETKSGIT